MAANETEWSLSLSEELPEGLSDESAGRAAREISSEATLSTSGSHQLPRIDRSWKALSFFSKIRQDDIDRIRRRYQIPDDVVLRIPDPNERACCPKYEATSLSTRPTFGLVFVSQYNPLSGSYWTSFLWRRGKSTRTVGGRSSRAWSCGE
jgi:hypothetical protein